MLGIYVHTHWSYNHPYAARTWTVADWQGFLDGVRQLGYDTVMIWPQLETMPEPPTPSDRAFLGLLREVIDLAHGREMRVIITACPNVLPTAAAADYTFADRPWFVAERRFDPRDEAAVEAMVAQRRRQFAALGEPDAVTIIDSDPGGWIGSADSDFVDLVCRTVEGLREDRPGLEFIYWMLIGWSTYNRFWEQADNWQPGQPAPAIRWSADPFRVALPAFAERLAEPWSLFAWHDVHREAIAATGLADRCWHFPYGVVEGEPTFPLTNCTPAEIAGQVAAGTDFPLGFMANAQTHCLQLPNIHLVAQAYGNGNANLDRLGRLARQLLPTGGPTVAAAWRAIATGDPDEFRGRANDIDRLRRAPPPAGPLGGLLFGSVSRFLNDLADNLRLRAALAELPPAGDPRPALADFLAAFVPYQRRVGYVDAFVGSFKQSLFPCLERLHDDKLDAILARFSDWRTPAHRHNILPELIARAVVLVH